MISIKETVSTVTTNCSTTSDLWREVFTETNVSILFWNCSEIKIPSERKQILFYQKTSEAKLFSDNRNIQIKTISCNFIGLVLNVAT